MIFEPVLENGHNRSGGLDLDHEELVAAAGAAAFVEDLFDRIPGVVFFLKDLRGRYVVVNRTLVQRCGLEGKEELIGRTTREVFPEPLGHRYLEQDLAVCGSGSPISGRLELHLYPGGLEGWCLTDKVPMFSAEGGVIGLAGVSRDLRTAATGDESLDDVARAVAHLQHHFDRPLRTEDLAEEAGMSVYQLTRRIKAIYGITPVQLLTTTRIDTASRLLRTTDASISEVAQRCGFFDQSAFSRTFKTASGLTPSQYRERHRRA